MFSIVKGQSEFCGVVLCACVCVCGALLEAYTQFELPLQLTVRCCFVGGAWSVHVLSLHMHAPLVEQELIGCS